MGPFHIQEIVSPVAYELDLPLGWWIHLVFHISKLKRYICTKEFLREIELRPPLLLDDTPEYEVEEVLQYQSTSAPSSIFGVLERVSTH